MFHITEKGLKYLDREFGSFRQLSMATERKQRILTSLEKSGGLTFDQLVGVIDTQRRQVSSGEMGWAPKGSREEYHDTLLKLVYEGYVEREGG